MQINDEKKLLRKKYKSIRLNMTQKDSLSNQIFCRLLSFDKFKNAERIFTYISSDIEVDTRKLINYCFQSGKPVAVPYCIDKAIMTMQYINSFESLCENVYGILEPTLDFNEKADYNENTLLIVPGLAFDKNGTRLGYGKGYYDRYIENFCGITVGLCFENCICEKLPKGIFDKQVDFIITEKKIYTTNIKEE